MTDSKQIDLNFSLGGKVALVTGGASGIGDAIASAFAAKGAVVGVIDINETVAKSKADALGNGAKSFVCDVSNPQSVEAVIAAAQAAFAHIDIVVNSAGVAMLAPAEDLTLEAWDRTIDINLKGTFLVSQAVGRVMLKAGRGGRIINIASQAGTVAIDQHVAYCASKFGVIGLSKTLAAEWGPHNINVNTICPGFFPSKMTKVTLDRIGSAVLALTPLGRLGGDEDLKGSVVFLASDASRHITGQALAVDGGCTAI